MYQCSFQSYGVIQCCSFLIQPAAARKQDKLNLVPRFQQPIPADRRFSDQFVDGAFSFWNQEFNFNSPLLLIYGSDIFVDVI